MGLMETPLAHSLDATVRLAIASRRLVEVCYLGKVRTAEPHDYGIQKGIERLLVYQLGVAGRPREPKTTGWRLLDVAKIEACRILDETFTGSRGHMHRRHLEWDVVHARVE